jgi:pimeloyl-ACP methyl ester carboxylesterase
MNTRRSKQEFNMSGNEILFVKTRFGPIAYRIDGPGDDIPLLLAQRYRATIDDWDPRFIAALTASRRVIRFDNAGVGRSSGEAPDNVVSMADVAVALIDALGFDKVDVLGWSLGGYVAQIVALNAPDRVRRLVIAGSGPGAVSEGPTQHPHVREVVTKDVLDDEDFLFLFFPETEEGRAAGRAHLDLIAAEATGPAVTMATALQQRKAIVSWTKGEPSARARLSELAVPTLVANGTFDVMVPAYGSYVISQEAPNARLVLYPRSGHAFLFQHIEAFTEEVRRFLSEG